MDVVLPNDEKAELYLLACVMSSVNAANHSLVLLDESDFYATKHKAVFRACQAIYLTDRPITPDAVIYELEGQKKLEDAGGFAYVFAIHNYAALNAPYEAYHDKVKNLSLLRKLLYLSQELAITAASPSNDAIDVIKDLQNKLLLLVTNERIQTRTASDLMENFSEKGTFVENLDWMAQRVAQGLPPYDGVPSGFPILDHTLGFFKKGCIYYGGARTSMGKTTFIMNLMRNMKNYNIGFFSLEQPASTIAAKFICLLAGVRFSKYDDGCFNSEEYERITESARIFEQFKIFIEDPSEIKIDHLVSRAKRMLTNYNIQILFVDYLTRIRSSGNHANKHLQVDEISKALQTLAKALNIPIVCMAQLNRAAAGKEVPSLIDFRESGSIEEDADACFFIHRPGYYDPSLSQGVTSIIVDKNRIRGIRKTIQFHCEISKSEIYYELTELEQEMKKINQNNPFKENKNVSY